MITVASCGELKKRFEHLLHETFYENRCWRSIFVSRFPGGCARTLYSEAPCGKKYLINVTESTSSRIKVNITFICFTFPIKAAFILHNKPITESYAFASRSTPFCASSHRKLTSQKVLTEETNK